MQMVDEDRAFWTRRGDAEEEMDFIEAWARLRIAAVKEVVDRVVEEHGGDQGELVSCGTAQPGEVGALASWAASAIKDRSIRGVWHPRTRDTTAVAARRGTAGPARRSDVRWTPRRRTRRHWSAKVRRPDLASVQMQNTVLGVPKIKISIRI
jgi:hypothetical protein